MGENERWSIKVDIKDDKLKAQVDAAINKTFTLYREAPQFGVWPVVDEQSAFHLAYADEKKAKKWIELFISSVIEYINGHFPDAHLQCSMKEGTLTFKRTETKNKNEKRA